MLGEIEEYFIERLVPGDTFVFGGEVLRYEALVEDEVYVSRANDDGPEGAVLRGGKFPLSTYLAERVRDLLADPRSGGRCRTRCANGWKSSSGARVCRGRANCWSRPFRAPTSTTSSAIRSRAGSRIRRSACC